MSKQYAVIGLGKFGFSVATTLAQAGKEVLAVDKDAEPVQEIADLVTYAARADITDSRVFASLGISNMDVVIVGIYCGNGTMVHCGDPIQYTSINTSYWQSHFYGFGRLN